MKHGCETWCPVYIELLLFFEDTELSRVFGWLCVTEPVDTVAPDDNEYRTCVG